MKQITEQIDERVVHVAKPKEHNFVTTELKYSDAENYEYYFLSDSIEDEAIELMGIKYGDFKAYFSLTYSLSHSQGDGVGFRKGENNYIPLEIVKKLCPDVDLRKLQDTTFSIETNSYSNHYCHENTFYISYQYDGANDELDSYSDNVSDWLTEKLREICGKLESYGYAVIEAEEKEQMCKCAFKRFKNENNIKLDELYDYEYVTDEPDTPDEYTKVATDGDTYFKGLWVRLPKLNQITRAYVKTTEEVSYEVGE